MIGWLKEKLLGKHDLDDGLRGELARENVRLIDAIERLNTEVAAVKSRREENQKAMNDMLDETVRMVGRGKL